MEEFVLLYRGGECTFSNDPSLTASEIAERKARSKAWFEKLAEEGRLKSYGYPLMRGGKHVASGGVIMDGPFTEGKEIVGGFSIVLAKDLDDATRLANTCSVLEFGGSVEVRPISSI